MICRDPNFVPGHRRRRMNFEFFDVLLIGAQWAPPTLPIAELLPFYENGIMIVIEKIGIFRFSCDMNLDLCVVSNRRFRIIDDVLIIK